MKKVILLATAFMFVTGIALADKGKNKKKSKGKSCCSKSCCKDKKDKEKTVNM